MASQQRVQTYLEKHRISTLFEDLMARLTKHLPNEPIPYLIKILQRYDEKTKSSEPRLSSTMPTLKKSVSLDQSGSKNKIGSSWAAASIPGMGEDRGYNRPWTANMKRIKGRYDELEESEVRKSKKESDSSKKRTPTSDTDVESLFKKGAERKSKTVAFQSGARQWAVSEDEESPPPSRRTGPSAAEEQEAQLLQEEMSTAKLQRKYAHTEQKPSNSAPTREELTQLRQKPGAKAKKHKQQLAEMAAAQQKVETLGYLDTGEEPTDPDQAGYDEAMDLLEDADELASEGVTGAKRTGQKVSKSMRRRAPAPDPEVKVTMCSKCARLIGGDDDTSTVGGDAYGKYATLDSMSDITSGEYGGMFNPPTTSDDDFESASQVVGPRHPVWVEPDNGVSGPSSSGLRGSMTHDSSRELFSSTSQRAGKQSGTYRVESSLVGQAWDTRTYRSQTEVSTRRVVHSDSLLDKGRSWQQPSSDEDSGF